jgi:small multidrug resistance pump
MSPIANAYGWLAGAIVSEVVGTSLLQRSEQFTRPWPTLTMVLCYAASFYCLSLALRGLPLGVAYAIWAGLGILLTAIVSMVVFKQVMDTPGLIGVGLIVTGVVVINGWSKTVSH